MTVGADGDVLIVGDGFVPAASYVAALTGLDGTARPRTVDWAGAKADHHAAQAMMEVSGPEVVPVPPELAAAIPSARALGLHFAPVARALIEAAPDLGLIAVARTGLENVDVEAATEHGIGVVQALGRNASAVAELQLGLMLAEARNIARADASIRAGGWRKEFPGARIEVGGRTVGMVGFGQVGRHFAARLRGFGSTLLAYDPYTSEEAFAEHGVERVQVLLDVFRRSDFVVVQARLSPETERFIGAEHFAAMSPHAYFVNVSRSRLVDYDALYEALAAERIAGAALDVFDDEPLAPESPWRRLDNVTMTTHFGGDTEDTNRTSAALVAGAIDEYLRTGRVPRAVNAEALGWRS
jgi:D-3-phosphoglycerate dehydrogenase / 2-oxoglutarate reductase